MKANQTLFILIIGILISCSEKTKTRVSEPERIANMFFETYKSKGPNEAVKSLLPTNKYISIQDADTIGFKLENLSKDLGDFQGYELLRERSYGKGITYLVYIGKYSRQPLRFNFKFYNPGNGWRIQNFSYETDFLDELDETIKPYRLNENFDSDEN